MARLREELIFKEMLQHGHVAFDNDIRDKYPEAGTTGLDENGQYNNTLAIEDIFDLIVSLMVKEYSPTDVLIHPLTWSVFVKNGMVDIFDKPALGGDTNMGEIDDDVTNGRLPVGLNIMSSPFIPFDKDNKKFHMYVIDRNNVGAVVEKQPMTTDQFTDPYRDIYNLKFKSRYGVGTYNDGEAIALAKNIALDVSYEKPELIRTIDVTP